MIFATVGTQLPFDRMLQSLDTWAMQNPDVPVLAQAGKSTCHFSHIKTVSKLSQCDFRALVQQSRLVVSHAGMGTILSAAELNKRIILMPRLAALKEHRNDHQSDTAQEMARLSNVTIAEDSDTLHDALDRAMSRNLQIEYAHRKPRANELDPLLDTIRDFVWKDVKPIVPAPLSLRKKAA